MSRLRSLPLQLVNDDVLDELLAIANFYKAGAAREIKARHGNTGLIATYERRAAATATAIKVLKGEKLVD